MADIQQMLIDIRFYDQILSDAKRTIYCEPSVVDAVRDAVEAADTGHLFTVVGSPACPEGKLLVVDHQALDAAFNETLQRSLRPGYL